MGNAVKSFAKTVAKAAISGAGSAIPIIGGPLASYINSKFAKGSYDIGTPDVPIPEDAKTKAITTPAQLKTLIKQYPAQAEKAGLTVEMVNEEVKAAKEQAKAVGGAVKFIAPVRDRVVPEKVKKEIGQVKPAFAKGGQVKKPRSEAQKAAIAKLVALNKKRREEKK
jgi:hypothetical protein